MKFITFSAFHRTATTTTVSGMSTSKSSHGVNTRSMDIPITGDLLLPQANQRLRHVNNLALPLRARSMSNDLLTRRKYLPKLQGNINPMQVRQS